MDFQEDEGQPLEEDQEHPEGEDEEGMQDAEEAVFRRHSSHPVEEKLRKRHDELIFKLGREEARLPPTPIKGAFEDRRREFRRRPSSHVNVQQTLAGRVRGLDAEALMEADEEERHGVGERNFRPGRFWWRRDRIDLDIMDTDSAEEAKKLHEFREVDRDAPGSSTDEEEEQLAAVEAAENGLPYVPFPQYEQQKEEEEDQGGDEGIEMFDEEGEYSKSRGRKEHEEGKDWEVFSSEESDLPLRADRSDDSEGFNEYDINEQQDLWWVPATNRKDPIRRLFIQHLPEEHEGRYRSEYKDVAPTDVGLDAPHYQLIGAARKAVKDKRGKESDDEGSWYPIDVALNPDTENQYTYSGIEPQNDDEDDESFGDAVFAERWYLKPLHNERLKQEWKAKRQVKPRRPLRFFNPDKPYPRNVFTLWNDAEFDWPEIKEAFTTMGHAHHPDSSGDELNEIVDPVRRALAKEERIDRFARGGSEIDLDLGDPHAKPSPQDIKRTFILADAGTEFDTPVIPLSKYLKGVWRYWEPTYVNACIGLRYWSYIAVSSTFVYFTFCRFEKYVAGLYPIEETRWYIPLTVLAISGHCLWNYGWRPLPWAYVWAQTSFACVVVGLYTYYHDYANTFEPSWDQLFLARDFSLEQLEEEGVGLSPGSVVNYFFGSKEKLNTRAILN